MLQDASENIGNPARRNDTRQHLIDSDQIHGFELTPRLSGGWDSALSTPERGADFIGGALHLALGERLDKEMWCNYFAYRNPERRIAVLAQVIEQPVEQIATRSATRRPLSDRSRRPPATSLAARTNA